MWEPQLLSCVPDEFVKISGKKSCNRLRSQVPEPCSLPRPVPWLSSLGVLLCSPDCPRHAQRREPLAAAPVPVPVPAGAHPLRRKGRSAGHRAAPQHLGSPRAAATARTRTALEGPQATAPSLRLRPPSLLHPRGLCAPCRCLAPPLAAGADPAPGLPVSLRPGLLASFSPQDQPGDVQPQAGYQSLEATAAGRGRSAPEPDTGPPPTGGELQALRPPLWRTC